MGLLVVIVRHIQGTYIEVGIRPEEVISFPGESKGKVKGRVAGPAFGNGSDIGHVSRFYPARRLACSSSPMLIIFMVAQTEANT